MELAATIVAVALAAHIVLKFVFFALPYPRRRAALDRQYAGRRTATAVSDVVALVLALAVAAVVLAGAGRNAPVAFLGGLWVGATLIQLYFHRFHTPLDARTAPPEPGSPIKTMSYAIQASPWTPLREILSLVAVTIVAVVLVFAPVR